MGQEVFKQLNKLDNFSFCCGIDKDDNIEEITKKPNVIIDFSLPTASLHMLEFASKNNIPVVIATTGFSDEQNNIIKEFSKSIPIFKSANMSYEINLMAKIVSELSLKLKESDIEIVEVHHNKKIDSPSGTALLLADNINNALNNEMKYEFDRHSKREKRSKNEIGIHSIRGGTEVGKHSVIFYGNNESFEITHTVNSRSVFANGAIKAAEFIFNKDNGLYSMNDMV